MSGEPLVGPETLSEDEMDSILAAVVTDAVVSPMARGERIIVDGMDITDEVMEELREMERRDVFIAEAEQAEIARLAGQEVRMFELGQQVLQVTPESFDYWGLRLGYDCWHDKQFRREYARDNDAARVKSVSRKIRSGPGDKRPPAPGKSRFGSAGRVLDSRGNVVA